MNIPSDRPDIVTRVFYQQQKQFFKEIIEQQIFGKVIAWVKVVEFQKRGLPHVHAVFTLDKKSKYYTPESIDKIIRCDIPNEEEDPELYRLVTSHMIHGPCGKLNPTQICMQNENNRCRHHFPFDHNPTTYVNEETQKVIYKRPDNGPYNR